MNCQYYGKLIAEGWDANAIHSISGAVYAVDESSFRIIGFTYDGAAPGRSISNIVSHDKDI